MADITVCEVVVVVAMSEIGEVRASAVNDGRVEEQRRHQAWLQDLRDSHHHWVVKTLRTTVPLPLQYEEVD